MTMHLDILRSERVCHTRQTSIYHSLLDKGYDRVDYDSLKQLEMLRI